MNIAPLIRLVRERWEDGYSADPLFIIADTAGAQVGKIFQLAENEEGAQQVRESLELAGEEAIVFKFEVVPRRTQA